MVIRALDHVPHCYNAADGAVINALLRKHLSKGAAIKLSFDGVSDVPSSFVNAAIVALLTQYNEHFIKTHLTVIDATGQIGGMIRRCMANGARRYANTQ